MERMRKATRKPFPKTYRLLTIRFERVEFVMSEFRERLDAAIWRMRALLTVEEVDPIVSPTFGTGNDVRDYLKAIE